MDLEQDRLGWIDDMNTEQLLESMLRKMPFNKHTGKWLLSKDICVVSLGTKNHQRGHKAFPLRWCLVRHGAMAQYDHTRGHLEQAHLRCNTRDLRYKSGHYVAHHGQCRISTVASFNTRQALSALVSQHVAGIPAQCT